MVGSDSILDLFVREGVPNAALSRTGVLAGGGGAASEYLWPHLTKVATCVYSSDWSSPALCWRAAKEGYTMSSGEGGERGQGLSAASIAASL